MKIKHVLASLLLPVALWANAAPFTISADGQEVTDAKTGLIWRRCAEPMTFTGGKCQNVASSFTHEAALTHARTQAISTDVAWRLPSVRELSGITDKSLFSPAVDSVAFPNTIYHPVLWSSSPYVDNASLAWYVEFTAGSAGLSNRSSALPVRLVRTGQ